MMKLFGGGKPDHPMADRKEAKPPARTSCRRRTSRRSKSSRTGTSRWARPRASSPRSARSSWPLIDEAAQPRLRKLARDYLGRGRRLARPGEPALDAHARVLAPGRPGVRARDRREGEAASPPLRGRARCALSAQQIKWQHLRYGPIDLAVWGADEQHLRRSPKSRGICRRRKTPSYPQGGDVQRQLARQPAGRRSRARRAADRRAGAGLRAGERARARAAVLDRPRPADGAGAQHAARRSRPPGCASSGRAPRSARCSD